MSGFASKRVCVVGGGYTGLIAALRLAQAGAQVTVIEAGSVVGGLASGFTIEGEPLERAYHHLFRTDRDIIAMAEELGVGDSLEWLVAKDSLYYGGVMYPFTSPLDLLRFRPLKVRNRIRTGLVALLLQRTKAWEKYKRVTALDWMHKAVGAEATKVIWEPLLRGKFHTHYDKVSMAWLWARIHIRSNSKDRGEVEEKLGYFSGGFEVFTAAIVSALDDLGVEVRTSTAIDGITSADREVLVRYAGGHVERYDACIATVPSGAFVRMIADDSHVTDAYKQKLGSIPYLGARLLIFSSEQDLSPYYWHNMNDDDLPFLVFINHTRLTGTARYRDKHVYYIATYVSMDDPIFTCTDEELEALWYPALASVFPAFDPNEIREKSVFKFANAQHVVDVEYEERIPDYESPLPGVFLCNFSQIYPEDRGTNYAVRDGKMIAGRVAAFLENQ